MAVCIGVMFCVVVATALATHPPLNDIARGLVVPQIPQLNQGGLGWTIALLGGVGGTLTVLCYGYWIREEGREGREALRICQIDLACAYFMTAVFGLAMVTIGSRLGAIEGGGATLLVQLADSLEGAFERGGLLVRWAFLLGAWGAVFSSLLGVWQSLPYIFADFWNLSQRPADPAAAIKVDTQSRPYRYAMYAIATLPAVGLFVVDFATAQKTYAIIGSLVVPALAAMLLYLNNHSRLVEKALRNSIYTNTILVLTILFFVLAGWHEIQKSFP
jgi:Mn2+/Fe2+ NRAMP family transporter